MRISAARPGARRFLLPQYIPQAPAYEQRYCVRRAIKGVERLQNILKMLYWD